MMGLDRENVETRMADRSKKDLEFMLNLKGPSIGKGKT